MASLDVFNLLNDTSLYVQEQTHGVLNAVRNPGRQFQVGAKVTF